MATVTVKGGTLTVAGVSSSLVDRLNTLLSAATTKPVRVAFVGSSTTAGSNATTAANRYVNQLVADMQTAYPSGLGSESTVVASTTATFGTLTTANGVHGYNAGEGGTTSSNYLTTTEASSVAGLNPAAVFHMIGSNDYSTQVSKASYKANVLAAIGNINAALATPCMHFLLHSYQRIDVANPQPITWATYGTALAEIAAANPSFVSFVDISGVYIPIGVPGSDPANIIDTDGIHQNDAGHAFMSEVLRVALRVPAATVATPDTTAPTVPGTPVATAGAAQATATTSGSTDNIGVTAYRWYRNGTTLIAGQTTTSLTDTGLPAGTAVFYKVSALDAAGNESALSAASNSVTPTASTDTTAPTVPTGVTATANSATQVTIAWTASTDAVGVASYRVRRGGVDLAGATAVTGTTFVDTTVAASTAYSYTVSAVDAAGNRSTESTAATVTTPAAGPATLVSDSFNRADSTTLGTADSGQVWSSTAFGITSNAAKPTGAGFGHIETGATDQDVSVTVTHGAATNATGIRFNVSDASNLFTFYVSGGQLTLGKYDASTTLTTITTGATVTVTAGTVNTLRATSIGAAIVCYFNGTSAITYTMTAAEQTKFKAFTMAGIRGASSTVGTLDDFIVKATA